MKINESAIELSSQRSFTERDSVKESLTVWGRGRIDANDGSLRGGENDVARRQFADRVSIQHKNVVNHRSVAQIDVESVEEAEEETDLNMRLLRALFERITGRKFQVIDPSKLNSPSPADSGVSQEPAVPSTEPAEDDFGLIYSYQEVHYERETVDFSADGLITTADGREIDFSLTMTMDREFYSEYSSELRLGQALKDPLVINYAGNSAELTNRDFHFDIDADGTLDQIAFVGSGSGFLALDKDGNGTIDDGSELFGGVTGDGFQELSQYDSDDNGWIDENDAIFNKLRIWSTSAQGETQLVALGTAGVGAIYLGHLETQFSIQDTQNELLGKVRDTGLAVMENGKTVTVQQLDLVA